jgi:hypothetical protein
MVQCVKKFLPLRLIYFAIFQRINKKPRIKIRKECKICCQPEYFDTPVWVEMIHPEISTFYLKILDEKLQ